MDPLLTLAVELIANTGLKDALAKLDALPLPDLVRVFHIHELIEAVFPQLWTTLAAHETLGEEAAAAMREGLLAALIMVARTQSLSRRPELAWTRFGEPRAARSPAEASDKDVGYALVYDPSRETAVYISGSSRVTFGQTWEWRDGDWQARPVIEHAIPEPHKQGFRGFHDPGREGIACWTLVARERGDFQHYQPFGLLVRGDHIEVIEADDPPVVPSEMLFVFGAIFGVDPASGATIMLARDALYALRDRRWVKLCALDPSATSHECWPGTRASFEHEGQLYFSWSDTDNFSRRNRLVRFTGEGLLEVKPTHPPSGRWELWEAWLSEQAGARFLYEDTSWRLAGTGDELRWQQLEPAPKLPRFRYAWGTVLPGGELLIGPGEHADGNGGLRYQRCFLHAHGEQVTQLGEHLEGVGVGPAQRTLLGHGDHVLAVYGDGRVDRVRGESHEQLAGSLPDLTLVLAGVALDGAGTVTAVAAEASVWQLAADGWRRVGEADATVAAWTIHCCAWDPPRDRLVVWGFHGATKTKLTERTAAWCQGRWTRLEAGTILRDDQRHLPGDQGDLDNQMIFDTHVQAVVFVGGTSLCLLSDDRWHPEDPKANLYRAISAGSAVVVHDEGSATTLFLDTKEGFCGRLTGSQLEMAGRLQSPPQGLSTFAGNGQARRAALVYVPASRSLILYASKASYREFWELPLAAVFATSAPTAERPAPAKHEPAEPRFAGPVMRRLEVPPAPPTVPGGDTAIRYRRFGEEPPADWTLPTQASEALRLVFDALRQRLVLVREKHHLVECWHRTGATWQLLHQSRTEARSATMRLCSDPRRGAVLWCVDHDHGTFGYRITDERLEPVVTSGDGPVRSESYEHRDKVAFVWDRREGRILACSTEGLWALGDDDRWSRLATWTDAHALHQLRSFQHADGGGWDAVAARMVLWKVDSSDGLRCWAVSAAGLALIEEASLPETNDCVLGESADGILRYDRATRALFRLEASGWVALDAGLDAPALGAMTDVAIAGHGDGDLDLASWRPFRFHSRRRGQWSAAGQPAAAMRPLGPTLLGHHHGRLLAANAHAAWQLEGGSWRALPGLLEAFFAMPWRNEVGYQSSMICLATEHEAGPARVLCANGVMAEVTEQGWELHPPHGDVPDRDGYFDRVAAACPTDSSWLMVIRGTDDAITFRGTRDGRWARVCSLAFSDGLSPYTSRQLIFDTRLGCFILVGKDGVLHLRDDAWVRADLGELPEFDTVFHDRPTGATLLLHLREGKVYRLGDASCTQLAGTLAPPLPAHHTGAIGLPSASSCLVDAAGRRLIWLDSEDVWGNYELDLTSFLA